MQTNSIQIEDACTQLIKKIIAFIVRI